MSAENAAKTPFGNLAGLQRSIQKSENDAVIPRRYFLTAAIAALIASPAALPQASQNAHASPPPEARVDINHASLDELMKVPGMTPSWAGRIIRFRPYRTKDDLVERGVVTGSVYKRIKYYVIAHRNAQ